MIRILVSVGLLAWASNASAQSLSLDLGGGSVGATGVHLILLITLLSIAPGLAVMITCFPFVVTVLSILRQAIGLQQAPPNMLIVSLALFLTYYVMDPVFTEAWRVGIGPMLDDGLDPIVALERALEPFRVFMAARVDGDTFSEMASLRGEFGTAPVAGAPLSLLVPSFLLSEIARAFQIGFVLFLPFLVIDLVAAAILMAMGMMMVPPAIVSLPFKLAFFVVADGWSLVSASLVRSYF